jgi:hypothetical protein
MYVMLTIISLYIKHNILCTCMIFTYNLGMPRPVICRVSQCSMRDNHFPFYVKFDVFMMMKMTLCSLIGDYRPFGEMYRLHLHFYTEE